MATRSTIAVQNEDGTVERIYCHWDGYLDGVGDTLATSFDSLELAKAVVALGDCSVVSGACNISEIESYHGKGEPFDDVAPKKFANLKEYKQSIADGEGQEYNYIFTKGEWYLNDDGDLITVEKAMGKEDEVLQDLKDGE
jgi:hypothetical protein